MAETTQQPDRANAIAALGFPQPTPVQGLHSIAHLFRASASRCGIYLLVLADDQFYIGQSTQVVRRFAQHLKANQQVQRFAFLPAPPHQLDAREKALIFAAETAGLTLTNVVHATHDACDSDLESLLSPAQQTQWLASPSSENELDRDTEPVSITPNPRHLNNMRRLLAHPLGSGAVQQLHAYLESAIPYPRLTEYSFWSVSCLPSTNASTIPRLLCVSASVMELFCIGHSKQSGSLGTAWGFINVASDVLWNAFGDARTFQLQFPDVAVDESHRYRDGGQHQVTLHTHGPHGMWALLRNAAVMKAAATLALRVMRKRANIYHRFHCPPLANAAMALRHARAGWAQAAQQVALAGDEGLVLGDFGNAADGNWAW